MTAYVLVYGTATAIASVAAALGVRTSQGGAPIPPPPTVQPPLTIPPPPIVPPPPTVAQYAEETAFLTRTEYWMNTFKRMYENGGMWPIADRLRDIAIHHTEQDRIVLCFISNSAKLAIQLDPGMNHRYYVFYSQLSLYTERMFCR